MILIKEAIDSYLNNKDIIVTNILYTLYANRYIENIPNIKANFFNESTAWKDLPYILDYDQTLHFKLKDDRVSIFQTCYIRMVTYNRKTKEEKKVPLALIRDIQKIKVIPNSIQSLIKSDQQDTLDERPPEDNKPKVVLDNIYENIANWLILDLRMYDIKCSFNYTPTVFKFKGGELLDRHYHETGKPSERKVIADITTAYDENRAYKCLFSRGYRAQIHNEPKPKEEDEGIDRWS